MEKNFEKLKVGRRYKNGCGNIVNIESYDDYGNAEFNLPFIGTAEDDEHLGTDWYTPDGFYFADKRESGWNLIELLPDEDEKFIPPEPAKPKPFTNVIREAARDFPMDEYRLTVRDQFAMAALTGMLARHGGDVKVNDRTVGLTVAQAYAQGSYDYADAMLAEREKNKK